MLPFFLSVKGHNNFVSIYKDHIAIIGAGISGLALGIVLKKHNIPCVIFEKFPSISEYGAGISISRNGQKVLEELGVLDQLKRISGNPKEANFIYNNKKITSLEVDHITTSRKTLHKVLLDMYLSINGEINFNSELTNINNNQLSFLNNNNFSVGHIAACDGIKSICRSSLLEDNSKTSYSGYSVWRSIINEKQDNVEFHLGPNFHVVTYPINNSKTSFVAALKTHKPSEESWRLKGSFNDLQNELPKYILDKYVSLKNNDELYKWGVYVREDINTLFINNVTLLGDAAHPIVPFMGQGGCLALEDGYIFGNLIAKSKNDIKRSQLLYKDLRLNRVKKIHRESLNQGRLNHLKNPVLIFLRNLFMKYTNIINNLTKSIWNYDSKKEVDKITLS
jgi:salicylate hydroxylase